MNGRELDLAFMKEAIGEAQKAELEGNLPIGCVIVLDGTIISRGHNAVLVPVYDPGNHAEIQAIRSVPKKMWAKAKKMVLYTTMEPCVMCMGTVLLHGIGRVVFGAFDKNGGSTCTLHHLPRYYDNGGVPEWNGPLCPEICDPLYDRSIEIFQTLPCAVPSDEAL